MKMGVFALKQGCDVLVTPYEWASAMPYTVRSLILSIVESSGDSTMDFNQVLFNFSMAVARNKFITTLGHSVKDGHIVFTDSIKGRPEIHNVTNRRQFVELVKDCVRSSEGYSTLVDLDAIRVDFYINPQMYNGSYTINEEGFVVGDLGSITRDNYLMMPK